MYPYLYDYGYYPYPHRYYDCCDRYPYYGYDCDWYYPRYRHCHHRHRYYGRYWY